MPRCKAHNHETLLRCGKCEQPICPDCTVMGPVGARCHECASLYSSHLFQIDSGKLMTALGIGLLVALAGGYLVALASSAGGFLQFWMAVAMGAAVGETVRRLSGRKRGYKMEIAAGLCAALGVAGGLALWLALHRVPLLLMPSPLFFHLLSMAVAVFCAVSRIRYL
jgi:hypothetical protein